MVIDSKEFSGCSPRQRRHPPKTTRRIKFSRRSKRQHCQPHWTARGSSIPNRRLGTLHEPAPPPAQNHENVLDDENKFSGRSTRQRRHPPKTTKKSSTPNRILRTLHAPALPATLNSERVVHSEQKSQDAPPASTAARPKPRDSHRLRKEFRGRCTSQRHQPPKPTRRSSIPNRNFKTLHAPAPPPAPNHETDVDYEEDPEDAPRASAAARPKPRDIRR